MPAAHPSAKRNKAVTWAAWLIVGLVLLVAIVVGMANSDGEASVPAPAADQRADSVAILRDAATSQGICYGWALWDRYWRPDADPASVGSNLGDGVAVEKNPSCQRWVQVAAMVTYTSESSEIDDYARVDVTGSPDIDASDLLRIETGLQRFGLTEDVFVADPGWAVTRAAVMLPLLAVEAGLADSAATPAPATASPSPLPDAGSDLLRDRWGGLLAAVGLLLFGALFVTVGVVQRRRSQGSRRQRRIAVLAQRARTRAAARTREQA